MVKLTIDDKAVEAAEGTTILKAAESVGIGIPHFCYHPRLSIAGNCRMCLVEVAGAKNLVISCKETVREGMVVRTGSEIVKRARADVLEFILINHPLDCPICDQSGECKLQDYYFDYSLSPSRLKDKKVLKPKAQPIGPNVILDAERCVECTRCIRFCEEIAGAHEIGLFERGDHSTIGALKNGQLKNPYSLCTVDLCPVGALTSVDFRFKKRVWYLKNTPSICTGCATACNIFIDHESSIVYRFRPRENDDINRSWLCDEGRLGYKKLLGENRVLNPYILKDSKLQSSTWEEALNFIKETTKSNAAKDVACLLSAQSSIEENRAIAGLCTKSFAASKLYWTGLPSDPSFGDKILRNSDRNPNSNGVQTISKVKFDQLQSGSGLIVLDIPASDDIAKITEAKTSWVILISSHMPENRGWFDVLLPKAAYAEQEGTFVNCDGKSQKTSAAFAPIAESRTAMDIAAMIEKEL